MRAVNTDVGTRNDYGLILGETLVEGPPAGEAVVNSAVQVWS